MATFSLRIIVFSGDVQHESMSREEVLSKIEAGQFSMEDLAHWENNPAGAEWIPLYILLEEEVNGSAVVAVAEDPVATKQNKLVSPLVLLGIMVVLTSGCGCITYFVFLRSTPEASSTTPAGTVTAAADEKPAPLPQPATPPHSPIPASVPVPAPTLAKDTLAVAQEELQSPDPTPQGAELLAKAVTALDEDNKDDAEELLKQAKTAGVDQVALAAQYERLYRPKRDTAGEIRMLRYLVARPATSESSLKVYHFRLGRHLSRKAAAEENATQAQSTYQEAINALSKVLDQDPDDLDANLLAGLCYLSTNNLDQAKKHFTIAYSKQSRSEEALSAMLTIALRQEDSDSVDKYSRLLQEMNAAAYNATYQPVVQSWKSLQWNKSTEKGKVFTAEARTILAERFNLSELKQVTEIPSTMTGTIYVIKVVDKEGKVVRFPAKLEMGRFTSTKVYTSGKEDPPDMIHIGKAKTDDSSIFLFLTYRHGIKFFRKSSDYDASHIMQFMTMGGSSGSNEKIYYVDMHARLLILSYLLAVISSLSLLTNALAQSSFKSEGEIQRQLQRDSPTPAPRLNADVPGLPPSNIPSPMDINRNLGRLTGILMVDVSGKVYVYVYSELEFVDSSKAVFTLLSGKPVTINIPDTYTVISITSHVNTKDNSDKTFISKYKIQIPAQITEESHLIDLKKSIEKLTSLSRDVPKAAPALTSISKALDLASGLYASGQRYAGGKWLTATEFKAFRSQEILKHFDNMEIPSDIKAFLSYYKETIESFKDSPAIKEQIRSKSAVFAQLHVFEYPSNGLENITETESILKLTDTEKADFLATALISPSMTFETAQPLVEKLKPIAEKTERAKNCYTAWEKHLIISKGIESLIGNFLDSMERAGSAKASLQSQLNILLSAEQFQAVIAASEKPLKKLPVPAAIASIRTQDALIGYIKDAAIPAQACVDGKQFTARIQIATLRKRIATEKDSKLKTSLLSILTNIERENGNSEWFTKALVAQTPSSTK